VIFLVMIDVLLVMSFLLLGFHGSVAVFVASVVAAACGAAIYFLLAVGKYQTKLTWILAGTLLLGYGAGTMNTMVSYALSGYDGLVAQGIPKQWVAYGMLLVMAASAALLAAGYFEPPFISARHIVQMTWKQERFIWIAAAMVAVAYWHGDIGFEGTAVESGTYRNSAFASVVTGFPSLCLPLATIGIVQSAGRRRIRFIALALFMLLALFPMGRRALVYTVLVAVFSILRLSGWQPRLSTARMVQTAVALLVLASLSNLFFMALRLATYTVGPRQSIYRNGSLMDAGPILIENLLTNQQGVLSKIAENLQNRTFLIGYLSLLAKGGDTPSPMLGSDAAFAAQITIPDVFFSFFGVDKTPLRQINAEEGLANEHFGLPVADMANSILTAGVIDFGFPGVIAYPLLLCLLYRFFLHAIKPLINVEGEIVGVLAILVIFLNTESELAVYFGGLRGYIILMAVWALIYSLPDFLTRSHRDQPEERTEAKWNVSVTP
jgi:hypothetical protein